MRSLAIRTLLSGALVALATGALAAPADVPLPPTQKSGTIEYLTGGIGRDEASAIRDLSGHWPLTLEFAIRQKSHAAYAADVKVLVRDVHGRTALEATADGPFLLAKLAPGRYSVEASLDGKLLQKTVRVEAGHPASALFLWPAGTDRSHS